MTRTIAILAAVILVPFVAGSTWLVADTGYLEFLRVAGREPWALQMLVDLVLACLIFTIWMVPDARRHGIHPWPYVVVTLFAGSIGGLAYLVHRGLVRAPRGAVAVR